MSKSDNKPEQIEFAYYVVALIDVLGQRDRLREMAKPPETEEEKRRFVENTEKSIEFIGFLREQATKSFARQRDFLIPELPVFRSHPEALQAMKAALDCPGIGFSHFSDTIVIYAPARTPEGDHNVGAVYGVLETCGHLMVASLSHGVALRGGIDVGVATICWDNEFYGPALVSAHQLESTIAQYPRIVVGDGLIGFLEDVETNPGDSTDSLVMKGMGKATRKLVAMDADGANFVDFLGGATHGALLNTPEFLSLVSTAREFVASEHERFKRERRHKLAFRYAILRSYFETAMSKWPRLDGAQDKPTDQR